MESPFIPVDDLSKHKIPEALNGVHPMSKDADLCIVCKDDVRLYVHRLIMSKWSRVIQECPQSITPSGIVEFMVEEPVTAWKELLGLIYPSPVTVIDWDNVGQIFVLADKYDMPGIVSRCSVFLMSANATFSVIRMKNDYVLKWLSFAAKYHQKALADKCMQFIRLNYRSIEELKCSPEKSYLRDALATTPEGVNYIIEILQFVVQQRR